ncbi:MAG: hypothetical protein ACD_75C00919G0002 [uncultured bacterium]|nr:MAG: hypothetical protein ACD_75C00919G0002 [uncultured bacterium]
MSAATTRCIDRGHSCEWSVREDFEVYADMARRLLKD